MSSMVNPGLRNESSLILLANLSVWKTMVSVKIVASGKNVTFVPVGCSGILPTTSRGLTVLPLSNIMACNLPSRRTSALNQSDKAFTHFAPTP